MFNFIKSLFQPPKITLPDPELIMLQQIHETHLDLLKAQKEREYWQSMVPMLERRAERLISLKQSGELS